MATQLPHLPEVEELSPLITRILGGNPSKVRGLVKLYPGSILILYSYSSLYKVTPFLSQQVRPLNLAEGRIPTLSVQVDNEF